jgi:phage/plasmid-like protein (TIGR03299 family)
MTHEVETMAYAGAVPWHGLGFPVSNDLSPQEMMEAAGCNWGVSKHPLQYVIDDGTTLTVPNKFALTRDSDGAYLDSVSSGWNPLQNKDAFAFFKDFVAKGDMQMHTAGSLQNGKIIWALAKVNDTFEPVKGDIIEPYILLVNPHVRGKAIEARSTPIRVVCKNTMNFALSLQTNGSRITVNHNQAWDEDYVKSMLGLAKSSVAEYAEQATFLATKFYEDATIDEYFSTVFPHSDRDSKEFSKNALRAHKVLAEQPGAELAEGSWWNAFNAVTWMTDHELGRSASTRLNSAWFGANRYKKQLALSKAVEYADAA